MTDNEDVEELWQDAFRAYEQETNRKLDHHSGLRGLKSVEDLIDRIESEGQAFKGWRGKHHKLRSALSGCLGPVVALGSLAQGPISMSPWPLPASAVLGSVLYLVKSCEDVSNAYDWIEQVFAEIREFSDRLAQYAKSEMDAMLKKKVTVVLTFMLRVFGRSETLIRSRRFREYLRVTFLGRDEKTKALLDDLNNLVKNEQSYVLAVTYSTTKETEKIARNVEKVVEKQYEEGQRSALGVDKLTASVGDMNMRVMEEREEEMLKRTLHSAAFHQTEEYFAKFRRTLLEGTGQWLKDEPLFRTWIDRKAPLLWVFGGPGVGKSYLSTFTMIRLMEIYNQQSEHSPNTSVGYFYIKENEETLRDPNSMLKIIAWQISLVDPTFRRHALGVCNSSRSTITAEDTWESLFLNFYQSCNHDRSTVIVLDGLDEAHAVARVTILGFLNDLVSQRRGQNRPRIQVAVFGRPTLRADMASSRTERAIEVSSLKNNQDIDTYISKRLMEVEVLRQIRKRKPDGAQQANRTGRKMKKKLLLGSDGVFLWAQLLVEQIKKKDLEAIEEILTRPPSDLDDMIWSVFDRLEKDPDVDYHRVRKILLWVSFARRPLIVGEMDFVLSLPTHRPNLLLWPDLRGRLASFLNLEFPDGSDPDQNDSLSTDMADQDDLGSPSSSSTSADPDFDFTSNANDSEDENDYATPGGSTTVDEKPMDSRESLAINLYADDRTAVPILSSDQANTVITFSHLRIRDFLVQESLSETSKKGTMRIYPEIQRAQVDITLDCLEALHPSNLPGPDRISILDYAANNFVRHLAEIDIASISDTDKEKVVDSLYHFFHSPERLQALLLAADAAQSIGDSRYDDSGYNDFWQMWISTNRHSKVVQSWFRESVNDRSRTKQQDQDWIYAASTSIKSLLEPLAKAAASAWLNLEVDTHETWRAWRAMEFPVWVLHGYTCLNDDGECTSESVQEWNWGFCRISELGIDHIKGLIDWADLEETTSWRYGVASTMKLVENYAGAISQYETILRDDPSAWRAQAGLASCYIGRENAQMGIDEMLKAISLVPKSSIKEIGDLYGDIADLRFSLDDNSGAVGAARSALTINPTSKAVQAKYIRTLTISNDYETLLTFAKGLDEQQVPGKAYSQLVDFLLSAYGSFDEIGTAYRTAKSENRCKFILKAMDQALILLDNSKHENEERMAVLQIFKFRINFSGQKEQAMSMYESRVLQDESRKASKSKKRNLWLLDSYLGDDVATLYFDAAVAAYESGMRDEQYLYTGKLKELALTRNTVTRHPSLLWGQWLRDYEKEGPEVWRLPIKAVINPHLDMLDDSEIHNDFLAFNLLISDLLAAGDRANVDAIVGLFWHEQEDMTQPAVGAREPAMEGASKIESTGKPAEAGRAAEPILTMESEVESQAIQTSGDKQAITKLVLSDEPAPAASSRLKLGIKGGAGWCSECGKSNFEVDELFLCEICFHFKFCGVCLPKMKAGTLLKMQCNPKHRFYQAWPLREGRESVAGRWVGTKAMLNKEWLEGLRSEWK